MARCDGMRLRWGLAPGVRLIRDERGGFLLREAPLALVRLSAKGMALLQAHQAEDRASPSKATYAVLQRLEASGLLCIQRELPDEALPAISVIIPVRNRPAALATCLAALERIAYPPDRLDVLVVDDASTDTTPEIAARWQGRLAVHVVRASRQRGPAACRNAGARVASGDVLAFLDSDCLADAGWLRILAAELCGSTVAAVGGGVRPADDRDWLQRYEAVRSPLHMGPTPAAVRPRSPVPYIVSCNMLVRRRDFLAAGGFDPTLPIGEDVDLIWRLCASGACVRYQPAGYVHHDHRHRLGAFLRRRAFYAGSEVLLLQKHPANGRYLVVPLSLLLALCGAVLGIGARKPRLLLLAPFPLYAEAAVVLTRVRREQLPISHRAMLGALLHGYGACLYYAGATLARYYAFSLAPLLALRPLRRWMIVLLLASYVAPALADYRRLHPRLMLPQFAAAHILDALANHAGLIANCLRYRTLTPLKLSLRLQWLGSSRATV